ncbi:MAG: BrnA antitoxin family protein [Magnetovibrio sp.]|nr:BrnA antitoxin family protein [Magnetovibrio sp.]
MTQDTDASPVYEQYRRTRGPQKAPKKVSTTIRLDADVIEHFKKGGAGWQPRINGVLKRHVEMERRRRRA